MYPFCIEKRLSTAFHPQTDGQTKSYYSVLERSLRSYDNYQRDDWAPLLALAKFAYNAAVHSSTRRTQFEMVYWEVPRLDILTLDEVQQYSSTLRSSSEVESLIGRICATRKEVTKLLISAQAYQDCTYHKFHRDVEYKLGQKVGSRVKNITIERPSRKLDWQVTALITSLKEYER